MRHSFFGGLGTATCLGVFALAACGDGDASGGGAALPDGCDALLSADADDPTEVLLEAMIDAEAGDEICIEAGTYAIERELSLSVREVTLRGLGDTRQDVVLDFADQQLGDDGIVVTADDFIIEHLSVKNTPGNGIVVTGAERPTFRDLHVSWDAGSVTDNGAYAVYPVRCTEVLIEDTEVIGAADAGIYVGQTDGAIVRNNIVHGNVAGIEIENTSNAVVHDNHAYDNTAGILVFLLPNLDKTDGHHNLVRDNVVESNNRANFAEEGTIVSTVPAGTGMLLLSADDTEIRGNMFLMNGSTAIMGVSESTLAVLAPSGTPDPDTDPWLDRTYIHDNLFVDNGTDPDGLFVSLGLSTVEDIIWDGELGPEAGEDEFCVKEAEGVTVRSFDGFENIASPDAHITDPGAFSCELPTIDR